MKSRGDAASKQKSAIEEKNRCHLMCAGPHEGTAGEGLGSALLRFVHTEQKIEQLRQGLSEFSHRSRNLLNGMKMSLYFLRKKEDCSLPTWWTEVEEGYRDLERLFDSLQRIYRPMPLTTIRASFGSLVRDHVQTWKSWIEAGDRVLEITSPEEEHAGDFDPICLGMALDGFIEWRGKAMAQGRRARLGWQTTDGSFAVTWDEAALDVHGPITHTKPDIRTNPGSNAVAEVSLPLLVRVITAHGGVAQWSTGPEFRVQICWPLRVPAGTHNPVPTAPLAAGSRT